MTELLLDLTMAANAIAYDRWQSSMLSNLDRRKRDRTLHSQAAHKGWDTRRRAGA